MAKWHVTTTFIITSFFIVASSFAGHVKNDEDESSYYGQCVAQIINHPLRRDFALQEYSANFYEDTNKLCLCLSGVQEKEYSKGQKKNMDYFFSGREEYFSQVDSCVLENVRESNYTFFNAGLTYDMILPLIHNRLKDVQAPGVMVVLGRGPANAEKECMTMKVVKSCQKIKSLFFTYKCLKEKFKQVSFFEELEKSCRSGAFSEGERI